MERPSGEFPYVQSVKGNLAVNIKGSVDAWVLHWEKNWNIPLVKVDRSFTTSPVFSWEELDTTFVTEGSANAPAPVVNPGSGLIIEDFFPAGEFTTATGTSGDQMILFTGINPDTGRMTVEALRLGADGTFGPSTKIAEAAGVVDLAATQRESGEWLVIYSTLEAEDVTNLFPGTKLFSVKSSGEADWTEPTLVEEFADVASELKLASRGGVSVLVLTRTAGEPTSLVADLDLLAFRNNAWSEPMTLEDDQTIYDFEVAALSSGAAPVFLAAYTDGENGIRAKTWNADSGALNDIAILEVASTDLSLSGGAGGGGELMMAHNVVGGDIALTRLDAGGGTWTESSSPMGDERADEVVLTPLPEGGEHAYLLSWIRGGDISTLNFAYLDGNGAATTSPVVAEGSPDGVYGDLAVLPGTSDGDAILLGLNDGDMTSLEQVAVSPVVPTIEGVRLVDPRFRLGQGFTFLLDGVEGKTYRIQASADLLNWLEVGEAGGGETFLDPEEYRFRAYRAGESDAP